MLNDLPGSYAAARRRADRRKLVVAPAVVILMGLGLAGCGHKPVPPPPPPAPPAAAPAPAPTVTLNADPTTIVSGANSTLTWSSTNAVRVELDGTPVNLNGSQAVSPTQSTDYQIVATSADGQTANAAVRVTVTQPPPPPAAPAPTVENINSEFAAQVRDAFFDYDSSAIRPDAQEALQADAQFFKAHPGVAINVVGHCDDRGSAAYNLALGDRRAEAVKDYLVSQGVDGSRITTSSVGKEQPFCTQNTPDCWQLNRRGHFVPPDANQ